MSQDPSQMNVASQQPPALPNPTLAYAIAPQPAPGLNLKKVATQQRAINICILGEIVAIIVWFSIGRIVPIMALSLLLVYAAVAVTAAVFIFMLAITLYNTALGVVLGILTLVPYLGLIVLLIVNQRATKILKRYGIHVGLLGANPALIAEGIAPRPPDGW